MENALSLVCHPDTPALAVKAIEVFAERRAEGALWLRYYLDAPDGSVKLPVSKSAGRTDGLWKTTCFEAFVRTPGTQQYLEFNAAPSQQWAAYSFETYREGMAELELSTEPAIGCEASATHFALEIDVMLPHAWSRQIWSLGVSAVIEEIDGTISYWALAHPPGAPDFHHPDCFTLQLEATPRA